MAGTESAITIHRSSVESLIVDAMVLIDEVETYFVDFDDAKGALPAEAQAGLTLAGGRIAARLTKLVDWMVRHDPRFESPPERYGVDDDGDPEPSQLPARARALIAAAHALFAQVDGLSDTRSGVVAVESPARALQEHLARTFSRDT